MKSIQRRFLVLNFRQLAGTSRHRAASVRQTRRVTLEMPEETFCEEDTDFDVVDCRLSTTSTFALPIIDNGDFSQPIPAFNSKIGEWEDDSRNTDNESTLAISSSPAVLPGPATNHVLSARVPQPIIPTLTKTSWPELCVL